MGLTAYDIFCTRSPASDISLAGAYLVNHAAYRVRMIHWHGTHCLIDRVCSGRTNGYADAHNMQRVSLQSARPALTKTSTRLWLSSSSLVRQCRLFHSISVRFARSGVKEVACMAHQDGSVGRRCGCSCRVGRWRCRTIGFRCWWPSQRSHKPCRKHNGAQPECILKRDGLKRCVECCGTRG